MIKNLQATVAKAITNQSKLQIVGNNSKAFLRETTSKVSNVSLSEYSGIVDYQPDELFITAKAGTQLSEIISALEAKNQFLAFMPPDYGNSTIGGTTACALAGSTRAYLGAVRDHILGLKLINGKAQHLTFGGQVIKNVAGFDVSRLMCGSRGMLGIITELSFKVLPLPVQDVTLKLEKTEAEVLVQMQKLKLGNFPIIASAFVDGFAYYRLAGFKTAVSNAITAIGGKKVSSDIWEKLNPFQVTLNKNEYLWRVTCAPDTPPIKNTVAIDWGGSRRWLLTNSQQDPLPNNKSILWQGLPNAVFAEKPSVIARLESKVKSAFDPDSVFI